MGRPDGTGYWYIYAAGAEYHQKPLSSYSVCADYYWYEIGDVVCIGNLDALYFCFPKDEKVNVTKVRFAAEELYKIAIKNKRNS